MHIISRIWESGFSLSSYNVPNYVLLELLSPSKHCFKIRTGRGGDSVIAKMITLGKSKTIDLVAQGVKEELVSSTSCKNTITMYVVLPLRMRIQV